MSDYEKLLYARSRLGLAKMMSDTAQIENWMDYNEFLKTKIRKHRSTGTDTSKADTEAGQ